ncbi:Ubiquitin carboxyl-terminal hydrolase 8-like 4 [Homarus americanus]|uniref:Ubiquitin carboxyl-terminal hydrolase n=1 Tax=Homarus americanus TaxID=6706 RepID=A0A8J5JZE6_HOMAM|nr:Ubiquitin carboxyl-terminal hydrolase 8-like 4 [Homarus americanus]
MSNVQRKLIRCSEGGDVTGVEEALNNGAWIDQVERSKDPSCSGRTALHYASCRGHLPVVQLLIQRNARVNVRSQLPGDYGGTALHMSALLGRTKILRALLDGGANGEVTDYKGKTAVHWAAQGGKINSLKMLQNYGCDLESRVDGKTNAVHFAAASGEMEVVKWLVESGVKSDLKDTERKTPSDIAKSEGFRDIHKYLKDRGSIRKKFEGLEEEVKELRTRLEGEQRGRAQDKVESDHTVAALTSKLDQTEEGFDQARKELDQARKELDQTKGQLDQTRQELDHTRKELDQTKGQLDQTRQELDHTRKELDHTRKELDQTKVQLDQDKQEFDQTKNEFDQTSEQQHPTNHENEPNEPLNEIRLSYAQIKQRLEQTKQQINLTKQRYYHNQTKEQPDQARELHNDIQQEVDHSEHRGNKSKVLTPSGLPNLGNTCYINSIIQCLFNITTLRDYFTQDTYREHVNSESEQRGEVADILARDFRGSQQREAHDLLADLLTWLHNDLMDASGSSFVSQHFHGELESVFLCSRPNPKEPQVISCSREVFSNLSLPVTCGKISSLQNLVESHFKSQMIEWDCNYCGEQHPCLHQSQIVDFPPVLLIHLSRYNNQNSTLKKTRVVFPSGDLILQGREGLSPRYELLGVVNHRGTTTSGHYTAYCRSLQDNTWRLYNDDTVQNTHLDIVLDGIDAHILFYTQTTQSEALYLNVET